MADGHVICGLDEAGRGALAGPLVVAAVGLPRDLRFTGLVVRDSKQLTVAQRRRLGEAIMVSATAIAVCTVHVAEIDRRGINWANTEAFARLIRTLDADEYVVDGRWHLPPLGALADRVTCRIGADGTVTAALAAGVVAKLWRDDLMGRLAREHPQYGWERNTGHGTQQHIDVIREFGRTRHHRAQFVETALDGSRAAVRRNGRHRRAAAARAALS